MTTEERFQRIEHYTVTIAEERKNDREEYKALWRDTQRQIDAAGRQIAEFAAETRERIQQLADESRAADERLGKRIAAVDERLGLRIESLESAIGEFITRQKAN